MSIDLTAYHSTAQPIVARFDDQVLTMMPKRYSTGSVGWYANGKCKILVGEVYYPVQVSLTVTIIGSKNSHAQEGPSEALEGQEPILLGPEYPYNQIVEPGANGSQEMARGIATASHDSEQKMRKRPRKGKR